MVLSEESVCGPEERDSRGKLGSVEVRVREGEERIGAGEV
jgi:hypothetical protein